MLSDFVGIGLAMGLMGILARLKKLTDHPSSLSFGVRVFGMPWQTQVEPTPGFLANTECELQWLKARLTYSY